MKRLRKALLTCAVLLLSSPAMAAMEVALIAPHDPMDAEAQLAAIALSPQAEAIRATLEALDADGPREKALAEEIRAFYESRNFAPLWIDELSGAPTRQAQALRTIMRKADEYGLDPATYHLAYYASRYPEDLDLRAAAEVDLSRTVTRFVTHIAAGRLEPRDVSRVITLEPEAPAVADILSKLATTAAMAATLARFEPPHPQYSALKKALAELRANAAADDRIVVPEGAALKPGAKDERVPVLRARLGVALAPDAEADIYDADLVLAVTSFQEASDLSADGIVGPRTLAALNGRSPDEEIAAIEANLDRWRWMPRDLGRFHVMVNVPEFMVRVVEGGEPVHETRVIVGKPGNPTPTFSHVMDHLVVNPFWNVPTSIVSKEMLPEIRQNPGYFSRRGYQVLAKVGGRYRVVDPSSIDWYMVNPRSVAIRQVPGDFNALGRIKFMFPNQHSVYLHDTPTKDLFKRDYRAFSHGCVRVDQPLAFADAILPIAAPEWNSTRLEKLYGGPEQRINLDRPIPVHLAYFTATVGQGGEVRFFDDIYGYDGRMAKKKQELASLARDGING